MNRFLSRGSIRCANRCILEFKHSADEHTPCCVDTGTSLIYAEWRRAAPRKMRIGEKISEKQNLKLMNRRKHKILNEIHLRTPVTVLSKTLRQCDKLTLRCGLSLFAVIMNGVLAVVMLAPKVGAGSFRRIWRCTRGSCGVLYKQEANKEPNSHSQAVACIQSFTLMCTPPGLFCS